MTNLEVYFKAFINHDYAWIEGSEELKLKTSMKLDLVIEKFIEHIVMIFPEWGRIGFTDWKKNINQDWATKLGVFPEGSVIIGKDNEIYIKGLVWLGRDEGERIYNRVKNLENDVEARLKDVLNRYRDLIKQGLAIGKELEKNEGGENSDYRIKLIQRQAQINYLIFKIEEDWK